MSINVNRNLNDWEVDDFDEMWQTLESQRVSTSDDQIVWKLEKMVTFLLCLIIIICVKRMLLAEVDFRQTHWKTKVPPCIAFFAWEACWERSLTMDRLRSKGRILVNDCYCCLKVGEMCNHLLLWCSTTLFVVFDLWAFWN